MTAPRTRNEASKTKTAGSSPAVFVDFNKILIVVLAPVGMTFHAVLEIGNALLQMLRADIRLVVFMASVAGIGFISSRMTGGAGRYAAFAVIHGEGVVSIEGGGSPRGGGVTGSAVRAEIARVFGWLGVTGKTGRIQSLELTVRMALLAVHADMRTRQREV